MILRLGDTQPSTIATGAALGLVPLLIVGLAFWAILGTLDTRTTYRGRKH